MQLLVLNSRPFARLAGQMKMEVRSLSFVASACAGEQVRGSRETLVSRVCTDSRQAKAGDLFVALPGERFDGHDFLPHVAAKGVAGVVVERARLAAPDENGESRMENGTGPQRASRITRPVALELPESLPVIAVDDTRKALGQIAAQYRNEFELPIIAVGGSNGKTTTKELIAAVLRQKLAMLWSEASFNNDIGVPLTLLRLDKTHECAVLEVGTNHPGELAPLVKMIQPRHGVITSIGREHLEFFGDLAGVALEEGALAELLPADGTLFIHGDTEWASCITQRTRASVVRVGMTEPNDWRARSVRVEKQSVAFDVAAPRAEFGGEYRIQLQGRHQVVNALFAVALGAELGLNREQIQRGLAECKPARMRLQLWEHNSVRVLDDTYNANADSMRAALETLAELPCKGRRIAMLGDMAELGAHSEAAHDEAGRRVAELGIEQLFAVGSMAPVVARAARNSGLNRIFEFGDVETAGAALKSFVKPGDLVLLKASRAMRLERVADMLRRDA
jgi:UDP-N-acetylmuramoyl-tripeptide--D-alanyl-D-alanine ligase